MIDAFTIALLASAGAILLLVAILWHRRVRREIAAGPLIELEKLVNCKACGSLIPEGTRRCAFCGAWQQPSPTDDFGGQRE